MSLFSTSHTLLRLCFLLAGLWQTDLRPTHFATRYPATCGDDAFFVATNRRVCALGVADGVGGWADIGVDPSLFALNLMNNCFYFYEDNDHPDAHSDPKVGFCVLGVVHSWRFFCLFLVLRR